VSLRKIISGQGPLALYYWPFFALSALNCLYFIRPPLFSFLSPPLPPSQIRMPPHIKITFSLRAPIAVNDCPALQPLSATSLSFASSALLDLRYGYNRRSSDPQSLGPAPSYSTVLSPFPFSSPLEASKYHSLAADNGLNFVTFGCRASLTFPLKVPRPSRPGYLV